MPTVLRIIEGTTDLGNDVVKKGEELLGNGEEFVGEALKTVQSAGDTIAEGIGKSMTDLGISVDDLKQLLPAQLDMLRRLAAATGDLRSAMELVSSIQSRVESVVGSSLEDKFSLENRTIVTEAAQQMNAVVAAVKAVLVEVPSLVEPFPGLQAKVKEQLARVFDAG